MIIEIYYKDPDAKSEAYNIIIKEKYPDLRYYSEEFIDKRREYVENLVKSFGELAAGDEDLHITIDTDNKEIISVNGSQYKLMT